MQRPSDKQLIILSEIKKYVRQNKYPPTVRELAAVVGLKSPSTMHCHLQRLQAHGLIDWDPARPRTLVVKVAGE